MGNERMSYLRVVGVEADITAKLDSEKAVDIFPKC